MASALGNTTKENHNFLKLCRLLYDGGTEALRSVFDVLCPPKTLAKKLKTNKTNLEKLKKPPGKVKILNEEQWNKLYPPSGVSPSSKDFDITLLFVLVRNICGLTPPKTGWDKEPQPTDTSKEANLVRIKYYRNVVIAHRASASIDDVKFTEYWDKISPALVSLGVKQDDIDNLKSSPLVGKDYMKLVLDWSKDDEELKRMVQEISEDTKDIKSDISDTKDIVMRIESKLDNFKQQSSAQFVDSLDHRDFSAKISKLCKAYHPNTRKWILDKVHQYVQDNEQVVVIEASPGMGKSVVAAKLCEFYKKQGQLGACHFFQHDNTLLNNPRTMLESISRQLCQVIPDYKAEWNKQLKTNSGKSLSTLNCKDRFSLLIEEPCSKVTQKYPIVVVIDALDECCNQWKKELFDMINQQLINLPNWLHFVMTTRPPPSVSSLSRFTNISIDPKNKNNSRDIETYLNETLKELKHFRSTEQVTAQKRLVKVTEGIFLIAILIMEFLKTSEKSGSLEEAGKRFSTGRGTTAVYEDYFSRLRNAIEPYVTREEGFFEMLDAVVAADSPIEKSTFYTILGLTDEPRVPDRQRKEAINLLHQLFPVENDRVSAFHKNVVDWLTNGDHDYRVKGDGRGILANVLYDALKKLHIYPEKKQSEITNLTEAQKYALEWGLTYMTTSESFPQEKTGEMLVALAFEYVQHRTSQLDFISSFTKYLQNDVNDVFDEVVWLLRDDGPRCINHKNTQSLCLKFTAEALSLLRSNLKKRSSDGIDEHSKSSNLREIPPELKKELFNDIFTFQKGFLLVKYSEQQTEVKRYNLNGEMEKKNAFDGNYQMTISTNEQFFVATSNIPNTKVLIIDISTLDIYKTYNAPCMVRSCHVFGSQPWFIVARCLNDKIYITQGETGQQERDPIDIQQNEDVFSVSTSGVILLKSDTIFHYSQRDQLLYTDKQDRMCELIILKTEYSPVTHCKLVLYNCNNRDQTESIPVHFRLLCCTNYDDPYIDIYTIQYNTIQSELIKILFSEDGELLAFYYCGAINVINTCDGSLHGSICLRHRPHVVDPKLLFLSKLTIVIQDSERTILRYMFDEDMPDNVYLDQIHYRPIDNVKKAILFLSTSNEVDDQDEFTAIHLENVQVQFEYGNIVDFKRLRRFERCSFPRMCIKPDSGSRVKRPRLV